MREEGISLFVVKGALTVGVDDPEQIPHDLLAPGCDEPGEALSIRSSQIPTTKEGFAIFFLSHATQLICHTYQVRSNDVILIRRIGHMLKELVKLLT